MLWSLGRCCLGLMALLVAGGDAGMLPVSLNCSLPLGRTQPPYIILLFLCFCSDESNQHKPGRLEINLSLSEKQGGKSHLGTTIFFKEFSCFRNLEMSHGHPFVAAYIYGDNA